MRITVNPDALASTLAAADGGIAVSDIIDGERITDFTSIADAIYELASHGVFVVEHTPRFGQRATNLSMTLYANVIDEEYADHTIDLLAKVHFDVGGTHHTVALHALGDGDLSRQWFDSPTATTTDAVTSIATRVAAVLTDELSRQFAAWSTLLPAVEATFMAISTKSSHDLSVYPSEQAALNALVAEHGSPEADNPVASALAGDVTAHWETFTLPDDFPQWANDENTTATTKLDDL